MSNLITASMSILNINLNKAVINTMSIFFPSLCEMSKYRVFSGPYFPVSGLNMEIYSINLRIQAECRKYGPEKTPYWEIFHEMLFSV